MELPDSVVYFLKKQGFMIVSSLDEKGNIHCSAKGVVAVKKEGKVFVVDVYMLKTFENLKRNPTVSITAVDENKFVGYTLQGKAKLVSRKDMEEHVFTSNENKIIERISKRVAKSVQSGEKSTEHFEAKLPQIPQYLIEIDVENIIDLSPPGRRKSAE